MTSTLNIMDPFFRQLLSNYQWGNFFFFRSVKHSQTSIVDSFGVLVSQLAAVSVVEIGVNVNKPPGIDQKIRDVHHPLVK